MGLFRTIGSTIARKLDAVLGRTPRVLETPVVPPNEDRNWTETYREMLREELMWRKGAAPPSDAMICKALREYPHDIEGYEVTKDRRLWVGVGLVVFGHLDALEETLTILQSDPNAANYRACRYYMSALWKTIPFPCNPITSPVEALEWFKRERSNLTWDEARGRFLLGVESSP